MAVGLDAVLAGIVIAAVGGLLYILVKVYLAK